MSEPTTLMRSHGARRTGAVAAVSALLALLFMLAAAPASGYWTSNGTGTAAAATGTLAAPVNVRVLVTASTEVEATWTAGTGGVSPQGYFVTRHTAATANNPATVSGACSSGPSTLLPGLSCTDTGVADGEYTYVVTAVYASWTAASSPSDVVTVVHAVPLLGVAASYSVLAGTAASSTGATTVSGDVGVSPGTTVTWLSPGTVGGDIHAGDTNAAAAQNALTRTFDELADLPADGDPTGPPGNGELVGDLGGRTMTPGVYHSTAALALTGILILDAQNDPDAVFVFQAGAAFNTAAAASMVLINGAQAANVYWVVTGAAGAGAASLLSGNILAEGAVTLGLGTVLIGRALSRGAVTLAGNTIRFNADLPPTMSITGGDTRVTKDATPTVAGISSAPVSSPVTVTIGGQKLATTVVLDGSWTVTATALAAGAYDIIAKVRAPSGDGAMDSQVLTVEVNPPPVDLGTASTYSVLGSTGVVNTGVTHLSADLGVSPSPTVTGFGPSQGGTLSGTIHAGDATAAAARADLVTALDAASSRTPHTNIVGDLGGRTFHAGVHHITAALALTGSVILDGEGDPDAVFIFQTDAAFNTAAGSHVILANDAQATNVFWVVTGAAGSGAASSLAGSIIARGAITLGAGTTLEGRALSLDAVTLATNLLTGITPPPAARRATTTPSSEPSSEPSTNPASRARTRFSRS